MSETSERIPLITIPATLASEVPDRARWTPTTKSEFDQVFATWEGIDLRNENADTRNTHLKSLCVMALQRLRIWLVGYSAGVDGLADAVQCRNNPQDSVSGACVEPGASGSFDRPVSAAHG